MHKLQVLDRYIVRNERIEEGGDTIGFQAMRHLLKLRARPDAVFCYNDLTAIGAIEAVLQAGLRVPEDVAVIGCGNFRYSPYLRVPLSSIDQNTAELGRLAGEMALVLSLQTGSVPGPVLLQPSLVVRQSTRRSQGRCE
jgi:LacI family transcriptional regulator